MQGREEKSIFQAIKNRDIESVRGLIESKSDVNQFDNVGNTPLAYAINLKNVDIARLLLEHKAWLGYLRSGEKVVSMLALASGSRNPEMMQMLLDLKSDINFSEGDFSPLAYAINSNHLLSVQLLLNNKVDVNSKFFINLRTEEPEPKYVFVMHTAFGQALIKRNLEVISLLLSHGASIDDHEALYRLISCSISEIFSSNKLSNENLHLIPNVISILNQFEKQLEPDSLLAAKVEDFLIKINNYLEKYRKNLDSFLTKDVSNIVVDYNCGTFSKSTHFETCRKNLDLFLCRDISNMVMGYYGGFFPKPIKTSEQVNIEQDHKPNGITNS